MKATQQVGARKYVQELQEDYEEVICYGAAFYKKKCLVKKIEIG